MSTTEEVIEGPAAVGETEETSVPVPADEDKESKEPTADKPMKKKVAKRGYGRPFAKLPQPVLDSRMQKLDSRIQKSKVIYEKAQSFYVRYAKEAEHRKKAAVEALV